MSWVADTHNNPFYVDDETLPPQRSAFAILLAERDDLADHTADELLERARAKLKEDPELATVYGRPVTDDDLKNAAARLENPADRLVNELLDFRFYRFDLEAIPALKEAMDVFRSSLGDWERPELSDLSLIAAILQQDLPEILMEPEAPSSPDAPNLPSTRDLMAGLAD